MMDKKHDTMVPNSCNNANNIAVNDNSVVYVASSAMTGINQTGDWNHSTSRVHNAWAQLAGYEVLSTVGSIL